MEQILFYVDIKVTFFRTSPVVDPIFPGGKWPFKPPNGTIMGIDKQKWDGDAVRCAAFLEAEVRRRVSPHIDRDALFLQVVGKIALSKSLEDLAINASCPPLDFQYRGEAKTLPDFIVPAPIEALTANYSAAIIELTPEHARLPFILMPIFKIDFISANWIDTNGNAWFIRSPSGEPLFKKLETPVTFGPSEGLRLHLVGFAEKKTPNDEVPCNHGWKPGLQCALHDIEADITHSPLMLIKALLDASKKEVNPK